ncbi:putative membrane protein [Georgenia soli]|uniref:Putative membrane protein n=1 Tax=Georgenia soli TaxID=638953 RepID=A0A2A9EP41_9MICO|nr:PH domain-containing protein [Georgenia soli]PFG40301.1 putative membrane protein [Georgenia soli]
MTAPFPDGAPHAAGPPHPAESLPAPRDGGGDPRADGVTWRRVHKITPILNAWKVVAAVVAAVVWQVSDQIANLPDVWESVARYRTTVLLAVAGALVLVALVAGLYSVLSWRRMQFAVTSESVDLHTGILFRQQRHARLVRIQAVDVVQPLLGRLFGLAQVRVETAGGGESNVVIGYLHEAEAQALRNEVMARAAGVDVSEARASGTPDGAAGPPDGAFPEAPGGAVHGAAGPGGAARGGPRAGRNVAPVVAAAPERELLQVPPGRLVASLAISGSLTLFVLVMIGLLVAAVVTESFAPIFGAVPALLGWAGYLWNRFAGEFGFRAALSPDGIRLRHGLLETRTQTLPPGRVQAVRLSQALLWRRFDWWRVEVNVAGYGADPMGKGAVETVLLPVGPRGDALTALWLVLPDLGVDDAAELLDAALEGSGETAGFRTSPRRVRWLDPLTWRRNGLRITRTALLMRSGRLSRHLVVVPHERTQSLAITQGPLERRFHVADLHAHSVPGPVTPVGHHLDATLALTILREQAGRARSARAAEGPEEWMRRVQVPGTGSTGQLAPGHLAPGHLGDGQTAGGQLIDEDRTTGRSGPLG